MSNLPKFSESGFSSEVLESETPVLVDFYADWCGPCRMVAPVVEQLAGEYADKLVVGKLDIEANPGIAIRYNVLRIPTLGIFRGGEMIDRLVGFPGPAGVREWVRSTLEHVPA